MDTVRRDPVIIRTLELSVDRKWSGRGKRAYRRPEVALFLDAIFCLISYFASTTHSGYVMRIFIAISALLGGLPLIAASQHTFADSSRLKDPAYVMHSIREISDEELWRSLDTSRPGLAEIRRPLRYGDFHTIAAAWAAYWKTRRQPVYVTTLDHLQLNTDLLTDVAAFHDLMAGNAGERDSMFTSARHILGNTIKAWGDDIEQFGDTVDFNRDIGRSGKYGFHYWYWSRPLLMAWQYSGESQYARKFEQLFNTWYEQRNTIASNIPDLDVVYYELGLGVRNRIFIEYYIHPGAVQDPRTHTRMLKTMLAAGRWLYELERCEGYRPGNWQIHGSYMLAQLALVFPEFRESSRWLATGLQRMAEHLERDFFADGGHTERCPQNYTLATYLCFRNLAYLLTCYHASPVLADRIRATMGKTLEWWITMITPEGETPAINDSHRGLFPVRVLKDGTTLFPAPGVEGVLRSLLHGRESANAVLPPFTSRHMPASGFTVMRTDWTPKALYMSINYGPAAGFHTHFDLLDFELYAFGRALAIDAGIGLTYDDPLYESWYRSSRAHNMVVVNDSNITREGVAGENIRWGATASLEYFSGEHRGYERFGVRVRRQIAFVRPLYWFVLDDLPCSRTGDTLSWYFHSPLPLQPFGAGYRSVSAPGILVMPLHPPDAVRTGTGWAASSSVTLPGRTECIPWIRFDQISRRDSLHQFAVLLAPFRDDDHQRTAVAVSRRHFRISSAGSDDDIYFADGNYADGTVETDARIVMIRRAPGLASTFSLVDGTYLKVVGVAVWTAPERTSMEGTLRP